MTVQAPASLFAGIEDFDYEPRYVDAGEVEMAYVEHGYEGDGDSDETFLCLHGEPTWGYLYRKMLPVLAERGRVIAPDLPGFGRSEKWESQDDYSYERLYDALSAFVAELDLTEVTLLCQDWGGLLGLPYAANNPERFRRLVPMNTGLPHGYQEMPEVWQQFRDAMAEADDLRPEHTVAQGCLTDLDEETLAAYAAPFPEENREAHLAGVRILPRLVPTDPDDPGAAYTQDARETLQDWEKPAFVLFSDGDPITRDSRDDLRDLLPTASEQPDVWLEGAAHFLQEDAGERLAERIVDFVDRTSE